MKESFQNIRLIYFNYRMTSSQRGFLKPADEDFNWQADKVDLDQSVESTFIYNPNPSLAINAQRQRLPIHQCKNHILYLLEKYQVLIVVGETGCGKSTQIPQYLVEAGWASAEGTMVRNRDF